MTGALYDLISQLILSFQGVYSNPMMSETCILISHIFLIMMKQVVIIDSVIRLNTWVLIKLTSWVIIIDLS